MQKNDELENETTSNEILEAQKNETKYSARGRPLKAPVRYMYLQLGPHNNNEEEYSLNLAKVIEKVINFHQENTHSKNNNKIYLLQTCNLRQGLNQFRE